MAVVPLYNQRTVRLQPGNQGELKTRANADAFGAQEGRALEGMGQAVKHVGNVMAAVGALEDETRAKEAANKYDDDLRGLLHDPDTGYLNTAGKNAVEGRKSFEDTVEKYRKKHADSLTGDAAKMFDEVSKRKANEVLGTGVIHAGRERKSWVKTASDSRLTSFKNEALVNFNDEKAVEKNIFAGMAELQSRSQLEGWDDATLKTQGLNFGSEVRKEVVLQMAGSDPLKANSYFEKHKDKFSGADQYSLGKALDETVQTEHGKADVKSFLEGGRHGTDASSPDPAAPPAHRAKAGPLPANTRQFLLDRTPGKSASHIDGLDGGFAQNVAAMIQDAPAEIRNGLQIMSGHRSVERQAELWRGALLKYGSAAVARRWVAPPGKSNHNHGKAIDLMWNGQRLDKAPASVRKWVHANASAYNLHFPLGNEAWHVEKKGTRGGDSGGGSPVVARREGIGIGTQRPASDDVQAKIDAIENPKRRDAAQRYYNATIESQNKQLKAAEKQAEMDIFATVEQGGTPDDLPIETRLLAGQSSMNSAWSYYEAKQKRGQPETDEVMLYGLRRMAASDPEQFKDLNLMEFRDRLGDSEIKELTEVQTSVLKSGGKQDQVGKTYAEAYKQSEVMLDAAGITLSGLGGKNDRDARAEESAKIARFQNALKDQIDMFRVANNNKLPDYNETQQLINNLLLPVVTKQPGALWGTNETKVPAFEIPQTPDGLATATVEYKDIDPALRQSVERDMMLELGRKPTPEEVAERYSAIFLGRSYTKAPDRSLDYDLPVEDAPDFSLPDVSLGKSRAGAPNTDFLNGESVDANAASGMGSIQ